MQSDALVPAEMEVFLTEDEKFEIVRKATSPIMLGSESKDSLQDSDYKHLTGQTTIGEAGEQELDELLQSLNCPIRSDGKLNWPKYIKEKLL